MRSLGLYQRRLYHNGITGKNLTMFGFSPWELAIVLLVVVLLFGTKRLPELGSGLGKAISNFKRSYKEAGAIDVTPDKDEEAPAKKESEETKS